MRRLLGLSSLALALACHSSSQSEVAPARWTRELGTPQWDAVQALAVDPAGNLVIAGATEGALFGPSAGGEDAFVAKLDPAGRTLWARQLGSSAEDFFLAVATDAAGDVFVAGATAGDLAAPAAGDRDLLVARLDLRAGETIWRAQRGSSAHDSARSIAMDAAGRLFVAGLTGGDLGGASLGGWDVLVARLDPESGATVWSRHVGTPAIESGAELAVGAAGGLVLVAGSTPGAVAGPSAGGEDAFLVALDPETGATAWARQLGTAGNDSPGGLAVDPAGNVLVACTSTGDLAGTNLGLRDVLVVKLDPTGLTTLWTHRLATAADEWAQGLAADGAGNVYVAGTIRQPSTASSAEARDLFLVKLSPAGEPLWARQLGAPGHAGFYALAVDTAGNAYIAGDTEAGLDGNVCAGSSDGFVVKYAPDGTRL